MFQNLSEAGFLNQPDGMPLNGGLALRSQSQNVLIEPSCCADLGNVADWRKAVGYRGAEWRTLWIGHPWLLVCDPQSLPTSTVDRCHRENADAHCTRQSAHGTVAADTLKSGATADRTPIKIM
jgi:hypothetical protein